MPFKPGQSGNPGGRPKQLAEVVSLARKHTKASIKTLAAIRDNIAAPEASRVAASQALLDRAWGKPTQTVESGDQLTDAIKNHWVRFGDGRTSE